MKKTLLAVAAIVFSTAAFSQVQFGFQVMGNAGNATIKADEVEDSKSQFKIGMGAGVVAHYNVSEHFGIRGSLNWLQKTGGYKFKSPLLEDKEFEITSNLNYLELPLHAVYQFPVNNATFFVGAGPSFGYGVGGKLKVKGWMEVDGDGDEIVIVPMSAKVDAFKKDEDDGGGLKRFDISASAIAGVAFSNGLFVKAGYLQGLSNLVDEGTFRNRGLLLTVGFSLGSK